MDRRRPPVQVLLGVLIVTVGVIALLSQLGILTVDLGQLFSDWWPLLIVGVGLSALIASPRAWLGPVVIIVVGLLLLVQSLDLLDVNVWELLWPVAVILLGLSLIANVGTRAVDDDTVSSTVFWWGSERKSRSQQFRAAT